MPLATCAHAASEVLGDWYGLKRACCCAESNVLQRRKCIWDMYLSPSQLTGNAAAPRKDIMQAT